MLKSGILCFCLAFVVLCDVTSAQSDPEVIDAIDSYIRNIMVAEQMVGMGVSVVREGRALMSEGYGVKDVVEGGEVKNNTLWYLASCSKALNAALISKVLSEDGRYNFDTRVREIWPEFAAETGLRSEHVTIRDVISHRTGVVDALLQILAGAMESRMDYISRSQYFPALYPFRDFEAYNNVMVTIGGYLVEILTGLTWEDALKFHLLDPLGMTETRFVDRLTPEDYDAMATAHEDDNGAPRPIDKIVFGPNLGPAAPSGGLVTSANDMQKWLQFLTNKGLAPDGSRVMNESDIMRTMTETSLSRYPPANANPQDPIVFAETGIALGWYNGLYRGYNLNTHSGFFFGFQSKVNVLPDIGMAVYTDINSADGYVNGSVQQRVHEFILDTLLGVQGAEGIQNAPDELVFDESKPFTQDEDITNEDKRQLLAWTTESQEHEALIQKILSEEPSTDEPSQQKIQYAGTYGNFILGNVTIMYNETADYLYGTWGTLGRLELVGEGTSDTFVGITLEPLWFAPPLIITFSSSDNSSTIDQVTIPFLLPQDPPTFIRDLTMADAPPPPTGSCEDPPQ